MLGMAAFWSVLIAGAMWTAYAPSRWRELGLSILAAGLVGWTDPATLLIYFGLVAAVWQLVRGRKPSFACVLSVIALVGGLAACKWAQAIENGVAGPLGFSYLVFRLIHVLIEAQRGQLPPLLRWSEFVHYFLSPALFTAGPLERWENFVARRIDKLERTHVSEAFQRIVLGLSKKILIADGLLPRFSSALDLSFVSGATAEASPGTLWLWASLSYLRVYLEFSGYSDIAVGAGLLWGRRIMENFNWPVLAVTPSDFWRRWHISLSQWCARYVYMPAIGWLRNPILPMFGSFLVMALWHYIGWNRVGWALYQTAGVLIYVGWSRFAGRPATGSWRSGWPWRIVSWGLTQTFVVVSYVFLSRNEDVSLKSSLSLILQMFGFGAL